MLSLMLLGNSIAFAAPEQDDEIVWTIGGSKTIRLGEDEKIPTPPPAPEHPDNNDLNSSETPKAVHQTTWRDCANLYLSDNFNLVYTATGIVAVAVVVILARGMNRVQANVINAGIVATDAQVRQFGIEEMAHPTHPRKAILKDIGRMTSGFPAFQAAVEARIIAAGLVLPESKIVAGLIKFLQRR